MPFNMKVTLHEQGGQKMKFIIGIDVAKDKFDCLWLKDNIALTRFEECDVTTNSVGNNECHMLTILFVLNNLRKK